MCSAPSARSVWSSRDALVLRLAVAAAWATLFADDKQWRMAIRELRKGFAKAKQTASEGVEAISLQRDLFAAAVGIPGLPLQQYIVDRLYAEQRYLAVALEDACRETCKGVRNSRVKRLTLRKFDAGAVPPKLIAARAYDATDALAFDVEMRWTSELTAEMEMTLAGPLGARVPVSVRNLRFEGPVRLVATPLVNVAPGFGALLISLPSAPRIGLDVSVAGGEVTKLPWLRDEIVTAMQANIADELLWPRRLVLDPEEADAVDRCSRARKKPTDDPLLAGRKGVGGAAGCARRDERSRQAQCAVGHLGEDGRADGGRPAAMKFRLKRPAIVFDLQSQPQTRLRCVPKGLAPSSPHTQSV